jgi:hypothetical protein
MKKFLGKSVVVGSLLFFGAAVGYCQTGPAVQREDSDTTGQVHHDRNWSWIGLLGLAGLAGLKSKKSEDVKRLEAHGVKVQTV